MLSVKTKLVCYVHEFVKHANSYLPKYRSAKLASFSFNFMAHN